MATISKPDQNLTLNLPNEGQIFRVAGDTGDAVYQIKNGQVVPIAQPSYIANTSFTDKATGQTYHPGDVVPNAPHDVVWLDPSFRGVATNEISAADIYKKQTGQDFTSLPEFNMGDIQTGMGLLKQYNQPYGDYTVGQDPSIVGYKNPNFDSSGSATPPSTIQPAPTGDLAAKQFDSSQTLQPPTSNLQPGMTGDAVKQLQDYLVSKGYMTQPQVDTGYGTYGPQTTAAVAKMQQALGVQAGQYPGYYGPQTIGAVQRATLPPQISSETTGGTSPTTGQPAGQSTFSYDPSWSKYGITQDIWNQLSPVQQGVVSVALQSAQNLYNSGASNITLDQALKAAASDPTIVAKYADALKIDTTSFQQNLQQLQQASTLQSQQQQTQFENDRRALAEQAASAGQAYSGFRGKAQEQLGQAESGLVTSSRADLQQKLQDATQAFEAKYGTAATTPATAQFTNPFTSSGVSLSGLDTGTTPSSETLTGGLMGGITGTQPIAKQQDINQLAYQYLGLGQLPT